jgi:uncharacterized protein
MKRTYFECEDVKDRENFARYDISFETAQRVFLDSHRVIAEDVEHSGPESRFYCIGRVGVGIATVRFTYRQGMIRIFGAGYWRKGKKLYETQNQVHRRNDRDI